MFSYLTKLTDLTQERIDQAVKASIESLEAIHANQEDDSSKQVIKKIRQIITQYNHKLDAFKRNQDALSNQNTSVITLLPHTQLLYFFDAINAFNFSSLKKQIIKRIVDLDNDHMPDEEQFRQLTCAISIYLNFMSASDATYQSTYTGNRPPLHEAIITNYYSTVLVQMLIEAHASSTRVNNNNETPLDYAVTELTRFTASSKNNRDTSPDSMEKTALFRNNYYTTITALLLYSLEQRYANPSKDHIFDALFSLMLQEDHRRAIANYVYDKKYTLFAKDSFDTQFQAYQTEIKTISTQINEYRHNKIIEHPFPLLGKGSNGLVYRCQLFGNTVAMKAADNNAPETNDSMENEALIHSRLHHPAIIQFKLSIKNAELTAFLMEYADAGTLDLFVLQCGDEARLAAFPLLINQLLDGVIYLHDTAKITHNDLKPKNLLMFKNTKDPLQPIMKIADFGSAASIGRKRNACATTPNFCSPEGMDPKGVFHTPDDIFSVGGIIGFLYTNVHPFLEIQYNVESIKKLLQRGSRSTFNNTDLPPNIKILIDWCWRQHPEARPRGTQVKQYFETKVCTQLNFTAKNEGIEVAERPMLAT